MNETCDTDNLLLNVMDELANIQAVYSEENVTDGQAEIVTVPYYTLIPIPKTIKPALIEKD